MAKARWRVQRRFTANIYASAFVIATCGGIVLTSLIGDSFGSIWTTACLAALFILMSLIPIVLFSRQYIAASTPQRPRRRWSLFTKRRPAATRPPVKPWKRRRSTFQPTPHGSEHRSSTFVAEHPEADAP
jgi:hypothetical protein